VIEFGALAIVRLGTLSGQTILAIPACFDWLLRTFHSLDNMLNKNGSFPAPIFFTFVQIFYWQMDAWRRKDSSRRYLVFKATADAAEIYPYLAMPCSRFFLTICTLYGLAYLTKSRVVSIDLHGQVYMTGKNQIGTLLWHIRVEIETPRVWISLPISGEKITCKDQG